MRFSCTAHFTAVSRVWLLSPVLSSKHLPVPGGAPVASSSENNTNWFLNVPYDQKDLAKARLSLSSGRLASNHASFFPFVPHSPPLTLRL